MYLSEPDIYAKLPDLKIETDLADYPFQPDKQVKVCSIDLRCDTVLWRQRKSSRPIDLDKSVLSDVSPRRYWQRIVVPPGGSLKIAPGEMILARTYEVFQIPNSLAGKITARSSYARLGMDISCSCDVINPGWRGHVPLEITNHNRNDIVLHPLLPLAQVFLMPLSSPVTRDYSDYDRFKSKYINDDGGPSYWWRDDLVEELYQKYKAKGIEDEVLGQLIQEASAFDDEGASRFDKFWGRYPHTKVTNASDVLEDFRKEEEKARRNYGMKKSLPGVLATLALSSPLGWVWYTGSLQPQHYALFMLILIACVCSGCFWWRYRGRDSEFYDRPQR